MKRLIAIAFLCTAAACGGARAGDPCTFDLTPVPLHPSASERIGLRLAGGIFGPGAGPAVARATVHGGTIDLDVVQTRERDAFPGYHPIGDVLLDAFDFVGPLAAGTYTVLITTSSFVDDVTNVPCTPVVAALHVGAASGAVTTLEAIEFYNTLRDRYFLTADAGEADYLDRGGEPGWLRTGRGFGVYAIGGSDGRGFPVDRFVAAPASRLDAHFFTASERESVVLGFDRTWVLESQPFELPLPDTLTGECPDRTAPVYRLFNPANGDHRWVADGALGTALAAQGWTPEGYGPRGVAMCSPLG